MPGWRAKQNPLVQSNRDPPGRAPAFTFTLIVKGKPGDSRAGKRKNTTAAMIIKAFTTSPLQQIARFPLIQKFLPPKESAFTASPIKRNNKPSPYGFSPPKKQ
jgi:hypothetical protein